MAGSISSRLSSIILVVILCLTITTGCGSTQYEPLNVGDLNELPPQKPAVITLSDPQIYSRETLVNDRRQEAKYLQKLLEDSEDAVFEPQIRRDLRTLVATVLKLQASFDPIAGNQAERTEDLATLNQQVAEVETLQRLAEARAKLIEAQRDLDELTHKRAASEGDGSGESMGGDQEGEGDASGEGEDDGAAEESEDEEEGEAHVESQAEQIEALRANVDQIEALVALLASPAEVRQTAVGATPREVFRDRQAYRGELRGALSEVELDDSHDQGQNSLYRLQFRATVLPGRNQDKMGVARLTLKPPTLNDENLLDLYKTWLGHATYRLNETVHDELHHTDRSYMLLGMGLENSLFHAASVQLGNGHDLWVALPPGVYASWKRLVGGPSDKPQLENLEEKIYALRGFVDGTAGPTETDSTIAHLSTRWHLAARAVEELCEIFPEELSASGCDETQVCGKVKSLCGGARDFRLSQEAETTAKACSATCAPASETTLLDTLEACQTSGRPDLCLNQEAIERELKCHPDPDLETLAGDEKGLKWELERRADALRRALRARESACSLFQSVHTHPDSKKRLEELRQQLSLGDQCLPAPGSPLASHFFLLEEISKVEPFMSASLRGLGDTNLLDERSSSSIGQLTKDFTEGSETVNRLRRLLLEWNPHCEARFTLGSPLREQIVEIPDPFAKALLDPERQPNGRRVARGGADVYATAPIELAQQISTTVSAFRSFELALALAASLPTEGVKADAGLNRLRTARMDLEARERLPLVVGFAERRERVPFGHDPQFGWVFGPQAALDAKNNRLRLRQPVVNQVVTADLSIPGWWPWVSLQSETAWVANWHGDEILRRGNSLLGRRRAKEQDFRVYLPLNRADLDAMTQYLSTSTAGGALPYTRIAAVSPERVTTCDDKLTFLVYGSNVWRSSTAFLNGLEANELHVLPDMAGLAVTFTGIKKGLPQVPGADGEATLTVWTRNGASSARVTVLDPKVAKISCGPAEEPSLKLAVGPRVLLPGKTATDPSPAIVRVAQGKFPTSFAKIGISVRRAEPLTGSAMAEWSPLSDRSAALKGKTIEGGVRLDKVTPLKAGDALHVSVIEIPVPDAEGKRHAVEGVFVFYPKEEEAQIQVKPDEIHDPTKQPLRLVLPYRYDLAFPDLRPGRVTLGVETQGASTSGLQFSLEPSTPKSLPDATQEDPSKRTLELRLKISKGNEPLKEEELTALLAGNPTLTVTIRGGEALPRVAGTVKLTKPK